MFAFSRSGAVACYYDGKIRRNFRDGFRVVYYAFLVAAVRAASKKQYIGLYLAYFGGVVLGQFK